MTQPMNILFLMADQLAPQFLPAYGHPVVKTPRLDGIAENSLVFDAHYTNSPLCVPARAGLMTGQLPSRIKCFDRGCDYESTIPTLPTTCGPMVMSLRKAVRRITLVQTSYMGLRND